VSPVAAFSGGNYLFLLSLSRRRPRAGQKNGEQSPREKQFPSPSVHHRYCGAIRTVDLSGDDVQYRINDVHNLSVWLPKRLRQATIVMTIEKTKIIEFDVDPRGKHDTAGDAVMLPRGVFAICGRSSTFEELVGLVALLLAGCS
jgi:hypothetical protein